MFDWSQIEFAYPWWFLLLPLPLLIIYLVPAYRIQQVAVKVPFFALLADISDEEPSIGAVKMEPKPWQKAALIITWVLLVTAIAKPMWLGPVQQRQMIGRDVMVVVDLSGSMATEDFLGADGEPQSRLAAVKTVLADFSAERKGDRLGLILFGDNAYVQAPFTADHQAWLGLVDQAQVGMAGQSTHLGDGIGLAIKLFDNSTVEQKVAIVLTDGNDTDSLVPPVDAARVAAAKDIRIHMIAMGDPATIGEQALDMEVIEQVATSTGGRSFQAMSPGELAAVYQTVAELEPAKYQSVSYQPKVSIHYLPAALVLFLYLLLYSSAVLVRWRRNS